jgi:dihydrofolate reductase
VAMSLDGYIAGPNGEIDWIPHDPTVDFAEVYAGFDTVLLGRRTYELTQQPGAPPWPVGWRVFVFSRALITVPHPAVLATDIEPTVADLRKQPGRDIWLFGGASLGASMLNAGLLDRVEIAVVPIVLGRGIPLVAANAPRAQLTLVRSAASPSGIVHLQYDVERTAG